MDTKLLLDEMRKLDRKSLPNEDVRAEVLRAAQALCNRLETPFEWVLRRIRQEVNALSSHRKLDITLCQPIKGKKSYNLVRAKPSLPIKKFCKIRIK